jgi:HD-like signal output (HDOD) protein
MNLTPDSSFESLLGQLNPIKNLPNRLERQLLKKAQVVELDKRDRLDAYTENRWILYLLEGTLRVASEHHEPETITPPSPRSLRPIFDSHTIKGVALSMTRSRVIKVDRQLYELLLREQDEDGIEIRDVQINQEEGALFQSLYQAYSLQKLELPTMPEVAFAIRKAMEDDDVSTQDIARIIQMDPVVSGGVMKAANSALYRGTHKITSIKDAIVRIGLNATRDLAISLAMQNVFKARHPDTKKVMHEEWERCVHVSALSYAIARHVRHLSPETAMLAGLLHRIGAIPILTHIDTHDLEFDDSSLKAAINKLHPLVGVLVVTQWGMEVHCGMIIEECMNWNRDPSPQADLVDVVLMAQLIYDSCNTLPCPDTVPAYQKLNLGTLGEDHQPEVLAEAEEDIRSIRSLLGLYS